MKLHSVFRFLNFAVALALLAGALPVAGANSPDLPPLPPLPAPPLPPLPPTPAPPLPPLPPAPTNMLEFAAANFLVSETYAIVTITVVRKGDTNSTASVNFTTSDGTARAGHNYAAAKGTLEFAKGIVEKSFTVGILNDPETEPNEFFRVLLSQPTGGVLSDVGAKATVTIFDAKSAVTFPPTVSILSPTNAQVYSVNAEISVAATASDKDGTIKSVEFFANGKSLGLGTNNPASARPVDVFQLSFKKSAPGTYLLTARATDNLGATATSLPVAIRVLAPRIPNVVTISATDALVAESNAARAGKFTVTRTGSLQTKLNVRYSIFGTANNGVDYEKLSGLVVIPAGAASANIKLTPVPDKAIEGDETVTLKVLQLVFIQQPAPEDDYTVGQPDSATVTITEKTIPNTPPKVDITSPKDGDTSVAPTDLVIQATAADADGKVASVSFFADGALLGVDTKSPFRLTWRNVPAGSHVLTAEAKDDQGAVTKSVPVTVKVIEQNLTPTVTIIAKDKTASEANPRNAGTFRISRTGNLRTKLNVRYSVGGTASNGVDYEKLSGEVVIPAGEEKVDLKIVPLADQISEGDETVVVTLTQLVFIVKPAPEDDYFVGSPKSATVIILDAPAPKPTLAIVITGPKDGATFPAGSDIPIYAQITGATERVDQVTFSTGDRFLAVVTTAPYNFVWRNVPSGTYKLLASAIVGGDMVLSSTPVVINVQGAAAVPFVKRRLPPNYLPGQALQVILQTGPNDNIVTHAVEDEPPAGWHVGAISDGGVFDATRGRVKFGPFFDSKSRALTYEVTPPTNEAGVKKFNGIGSLDGVQSPVVGDDTINTASFHPADSVPADFRITLVELTAYAAAWKKNLPWPVNPNPIPASYVTRASEIWQSGEEYIFDPQAGPAPLWWVGKKGVRAQAAATRATIVSPAFVAGNSVHRFVSPNRDTTLEVELAVSTSPGVTAGAFEESIASGWSVEDVSDGGFFDESSRTIRWGVFYNGQPRVLSYRLTGSATTTEAPKFSGRAAFDGRIVEVKFGNQPPR